MLKCPSEAFLLKSGNFKGRMLDIQGDKHSIGNVLGVYSGPLCLIGLVNEKGS